MQKSTILLVGTFDTKPTELKFMMQHLVVSGCDVLAMDVSVLGNTDVAHHITKHQVAEASNTTIDKIIAYNDENTAMIQMSKGACVLTQQYYQNGRIQGVIILGGSMGTDLALDVVNVLPLGVPKMIVSTVSFSHMIQPDRLPADVMMVLWSGGLYGMGDVCRRILAQSCGAIAGATQSVQQVQATQKPRVGIVSLGKSCLQYMVYLVPELEKRGYDVSVFHATGMGGQAFENLVSQGYFCAVFDFCLQEISNYLSGKTPIHAGKNRMTSASIHNIPQLLAPGATDIVDLVAWQTNPVDFKDRAYHQHNRLISSVNMTADERKNVANDIVQKLQNAHKNTVFIIPKHGIEQWDKKGAPMYDPDGLDGFLNMLQSRMPAHVQMEVLSCHINDKQFADCALKIFDKWGQMGIVPKPQI